MRRLGKCVKSDSAYSYRCRGLSPRVNPAPTSSKYYGGIWSSFEAPPQWCHHVLQLIYGCRAHESMRTALHARPLMLNVSILTVPPGGQCAGSHLPSMRKIFSSRPPTTPTMDTSMDTTLSHDIDDRHDGVPFRRR